MRGAFALAVPISKTAIRLAFSHPQRAGALDVRESHGLVGTQRFSEADESTS